MGGRLRLAFALLICWSRHTPAGHPSGFWVLNSCCIAFFFVVPRWGWKKMPYPSLQISSVIRQNGWSFLCAPCLSNTRRGSGPNDDDILELEPPLGSRSRSVPFVYNLQRWHAKFISTESPVLWYKSGCCLGASWETTDSNLEICLAFAELLLSMCLASKGPILTDILCNKYVL